MTIGDRIKRYEETSKYHLTPRQPVFIRIDGKAFHTFTRNMKKPFDTKFMECMVCAGEITSKEMMGFKLGYHQSDEFTFVLTDLDTFETQTWFDNELQKIVSISSSMFTANFNSLMGGTKAVFDARAFSVPLEDAANVFIWRQRDWERNSIQMLSRSRFSHKQLMNKKVPEMHEMLFSVGVNWSDLDDNLKNGTFITKDKKRICNKLSYEDIQKMIHDELRQEIESNYRIPVENEV